jgi:hypothetical protein
MIMVTGDRIWLPAPILLSLIIRANQALHIAGGGLGGVTSENLPEAPAGRVEEYASAEREI